MSSPDLRGATVHWGVDDWKKPREELWPQGTVPVDDCAVQTPLDGDTLTLVFPEVRRVKKGGRGVPGACEPFHVDAPRVRVCLCFVEHGERGDGAGAMSVLQRFPALGV